MATEKNGTKPVVKLVAGPIRNLGNIAGALNSNIPLGPDFAHGLAAMRWNVPFTMGQVTDLPVK